MRENIAENQMFFFFQNAFCCSNSITLSLAMPNQGGCVLQGLSPRLLSFTVKSALLILICRRLSLAFSHYFVVYVYHFLYFQLLVMISKMVLKCKRFIITTLLCSRYLF